MAGNSYQTAAVSPQAAVTTVVPESTGTVRSVTLNVAGQRITIRTDQNAEYLSGLAYEVNVLVDSLRQAAPGAGLPQLMALAAIQLADRASAAEAAVDQSNRKVESHIKRLSDILSTLDQMDAKI